MPLILIIEDDSLLRESTAMFLQEEGFSTLTARNGLLGLQAAINHKPDLILCDIAMPRVDGYEVLGTIREHPQVSGIPLVFLTAKTEENEVEYALSLGANDYIFKPFDFNQLLQIINKHLLI